MSHMRGLLLVTCLGVAFSAPIATSDPANADITDIVINSTSEIGPFRGKQYQEIVATMNGTAPGGSYSVPVTLAFPKRAGDHNGFAVVDIINTVPVVVDQWVLDRAPLPLARIHIGDEFLFGAGNAYVGVTWDKKAVEQLGSGVIAQPSDAKQILLDAVTLVRDPMKHLPAGIDSARASGKIVAYGYSQTGGLLRGWYFDHLNTQGGTAVFDGALVAAAGGACLDLVTGWKDCGGPLADGGKVIVLSTETDAELGGYAERGEHPDYRVIEIAGVSHIPASAANFRQHGMPDQNPVGFEAVFRAALVNLQAWLGGEEPPPSIMIDISDTPSREWDGVAIRPALRDTDGNALGGVRLPHMLAVLDDGTKAGAPLGQYTGLAWNYEENNWLFVISGTYKPFSQDKLRDLYPTQDAYVSAVSRAAARLESQRYILKEDSDAYVEAATKVAVSP